MRQSVICPFFGALRDRFCDYGEELDTAAKLAAIARVPGVDGVEIVYPQELRDIDAVKTTLGRLGLAVSAVNVNVKSEREFVTGAFISQDATVRARAVDYVCRAKDAAAMLGAERVTCCPLADGHDYSFQMHYGAIWRRMVECIREAAAYRPDITLSLEYKPWETRVQNVLNSAARTVLLCHSAGGEGLGVTVDIGHSTFGGERAADSLMVVAAAGLPVYIHTNDNNGRADWDLVAGSCNLWDYAEFLFYAKEIGYDGWLTSDVAPVRQNAHEIFAMNIRVTRQIWRWLDEIDRDAVRDGLLRHDFIGVRKLMEPYLFPLLRSEVAARRG